jgi:formylglycine-generating enzyme required for sulfatase activity
MLGLALLAACAPTGPTPVAVTAPATSAPKPASAPVRKVPVEWQSRLPRLKPADVEKTLGMAGAALTNGQLERGNGANPGALELYLAVIQIEPDSEPAQEGVRASMEALFERGRIAMRSGDIALAEHIESIARSVQPDHQDLPDYRSYLAQARAAKLADQQMRQQLAQAWARARAEDFKGADQWLLAAQKSAPDAPGPKVLGLRIIELRQARTDALLAQGNAAVDRLQLDRADRLLTHVARIAAQPARAQLLRERIHLARHYGPFKPAQVFSERLAGGAKAPEMVVVPYGRFAMGAGDHDPQSQANEQPQHEVVFKRGFAIARNEITVGDFRRFIVASGYRTLATRSGASTVYDIKGGVFGEHVGVDWRLDHFGRVAAPELPVLHVAFEDAQAYARWLTRQTGARYRLPSEAEFEYALRAGTNSIYPWGDAAPARVVGNLAGDGDLSPSGRRWGNAVAHYRDAFWGVAAVRTFPMESIGSYDMVGNVSEWTLDCWHENYQRAPNDGSAWVNPGCIQRVVRGAAWDSALVQARSAYREATDATTRSARLGFRVVREL